MNHKKKRQRLRFQSRRVPKKQTTAVPLPERVTPPSEETEDLQPDPQPPQKERWADLGLNALQP